MYFEFIINCQLHGETNEPTTKLLFSMEQPFHIWLETISILKPNYCKSPTDAVHGLPEGIFEICCT